MSQKPIASLFLERSLLFSFFIHIVALIAMTAILFNGLPGGTEAEVSARGQFVASHPWLWRLGWLPWQLTALSDLLIGVAVVRTAWIPRGAAWFTLLATLAAIIPDQTGEGRWITEGIEVATQATQSSDWSSYQRFEERALFLIGGVAGSLYIVMAIGWSWCFAAAGTWSRFLTYLSVAAWTLLLLPSLALLLPPEKQPAPIWLALGNALGFPLLLLWFVLVMELVLRRSRPDETHGRAAPWRHFRAGWLGGGFNLLANSRLVRNIAEYLPPVSFVSDITNVIYVNYLVEAAQLEALLPAELELQRLGPSKQYAMLTFLTYRHGHFGPALLGPLRKLLPSPVHSNWRIYVGDPATGKEGVYFFTNGIDSTLHALAARLMSEGMPMYALARGAVIAEADGAFRVSLDPGAGSGPDAEVHLKPTPDRTLTPPWNECFESYQAMLAYCVPQDRALSSQPWYRRITRQEIQLGIPLESCEPLMGTVQSKAAEQHVGAAAALCFRVARVNFRFDREEYDYRPLESP